MIIVQNPATGEEIERVEESSESSLRETFARLKQHQSPYDLAKRKAALREFASDLHTHQEELAHLLSLEVGKPIRQARAEIAGTIKRTAFYVDHIDLAAQAHKVAEKPGFTEAISFEPLGLILCISPWNYPYFVSTNVILPALLAGCSVVFKPSELAVLSGQRLGQLLCKQAAFKDSLALAIGGKDVGAQLVDLPFDGLFFTGSEKAGFSIKSAINSRMVVSQFELGGKDAVYICDDCDLEKTVPSVVDGSFYNNGQGCCSIERIYVHTQIAERFLELFVSAVKNLPIGPPLHENTYIGPLTRREQLAFLKNQVTDAQKRGAQIALGGYALAGPGNYFSPTVIMNANESMEVMREESFGPIVGVECVKSDEEAIHKINHSRFGLTGAVYSKDRARAERILSALEVGTAYWNCCDRVSPNLPWSGRKNSGLGLTLSTLGLAAFYRPKAWHLKAQPGS